MTKVSPTTPVGLLYLHVQARVARAKRSEGGASVVEWIVIAAIVVALAIGLAALLRSALQDEAGEIGEEIRGQ